MFQPFKPFKSLFGQNDVTRILEQLGVPGTTQTFADRLVQSQRNNGSLHLTVDLPADLHGHLPYLQQFLLEQLKPAGIEDLTLSVAGETARQAQDTAETSAKSSSASYQTNDAALTGSKAQLNSSMQSQQSDLIAPVVSAASVASGFQSQSQSAGQRQSQSQHMANTHTRMSQYQGTHGQTQHISHSAVDAMTGTHASSEPHPSASPNRPVPPRQHELKAHPHIRHVIVIASGKGGVGKSTTSVNLALALKAAGARVGLLDADIYGPSIPTMLGIEGQTPRIEDEKFVPIEAFGLATLSIGNLLGDDQPPVAWRGPKATGALLQLFGQTVWPQLDYLIIDLPPGTGDIQLTLAQRIPVTAAVIVTTPQHVALMDAQKGIELFNKVDIPVIGVIENMATHICSACGHADAIFGEGGAQTLGQRYDVPVLGQLPLDRRIREQMDRGQPNVSHQDDITPYYQQIALRVIEQVARLPQLPERQSDPKRIL